MRVAVYLVMLSGVLVGVTQGSSVSGLLPRSASLLDQEDTKEKRILSHEDDSDNGQKDVKMQILDAVSSDLEDKRLKRSPVVITAAGVTAVAASASAAAVVAQAAKDLKLHHAVEDVGSAVVDTGKTVYGWVSSIFKRSVPTFNKVSNGGQRRKRQTGEGKLDIFGIPVLVI